MFKKGLKDWLIGLSVAFLLFGLVALLSKVGVMSDKMVGGLFVWVFGISFLLVGIGWIGLVGYLLVDIFKANKKDKNEEQQKEGCESFSRKN